MNGPRLALLVTAALLAALVLLGFSLQMGWRGDGARWPHHVLYFAVTASLAVTMLLLWRGPQPAWPLLPALLLLLTMPLTRPGRADHWQRALLVALAFVLGLVAVY